MPFGVRADNTQKGRGFLGVLNRPGGGVSTELSVGINFDGKETEIPTLIPTLDENEKSHLLGGGKPTQEIINKAVIHAKQRMAQGKSPFVQEGEQTMPQFSLQQQLEALAPEELEQLKQHFLGEVETQRGGSPTTETPTPGRNRILGEAARGVTSGLRSFGEGALLALQNRPISELSKRPERKTDKTAAFLQQERLKDITDPRRREALEMEATRKRLRQEREPGEVGVRDIEGVGVGQEQIAERTQTPAKFIEIQKGIDKFGDPKFDTVKNPDFESYQKEQDLLRKDRVEAFGKSRASQRMSLTQIDLIANSARLFAQTHADAIREGGLGSLGAEMASNIAFYFGGEPAEKFEQTEATEGLKTEIISRLMPTLTQQGDKPGSVRLVQTIFAKLEKTLPGKRTPAKNAKNMFSKTLTNAFNFARAAARLGLTNEFIETVPDEELNKFSTQVANIAAGITLTEPEQDALDLLLNTALQPYDELVLERGDQESALKQKYGLE